jgi:transposase
MLASGAVAQVVADRHGISTGLIYTWRKQMLKAAMARFAGVEIKPDTSVALPGPPPMMVEVPLHPCQIGRMSITRSPH